MPITSNLRCVFALGPGDWTPGTPRYNYVSLWASGATEQMLTTGVTLPTEYFGLTMSGSENQDSQDLAADLPTANTRAGWEAFLARNPSVRFEGRYVPAVYNQRLGVMWALPGHPESDFLAALDVSIAAIASTPGGSATYRPCTAMQPRANQYAQGAVQELTDEVTPESNPLMPNTSTVKVADDHEALNTRSCSSCGRVGHNSRTCSTVEAKPYDKIGIEIEGRWHDLASVRAMATTMTGTEGYHDGSVRGGTSGAAAWEFQTRPGSVSSALTQLHAMYPDEVDSSCGMHIHVSFAPTNIFLIANTDFFQYFRDRWTQWGTRMRIRPGTEFWERLNGRNTYCRINTEVPRDLINMDRYHQLNFSAWDRHKTVECRLLPMFKHEKIALAAVQELISIYADWFAMDHSSRMPSTEVSLPAYQLVPDVTAYTVDLPSTTYRTDTHLEVAELPPVAPGLLRVAIPTGRTMDNTSVLDRIRTYTAPNSANSSRETERQAA